jgi:hypothetical protein
MNEYTLGALFAAQPMRLAPGILKKLKKVRSHVLYAAKPYLLTRASFPIIHSWRNEKKIISNLPSTMLRTTCLYIIQLRNDSIHVVTLRRYVKTNTNNR